MTQNVNDLFETIHKSQRLFTHEDAHQKIGVKDVRCSVFIENKKLIVKGEYNLPNASQRTAMIFLMDPSTNEVKGEYLTVSS